MGAGRGGTLDGDLGVFRASVNGLDGLDCVVENSALVLESESRVPCRQHASFNALGSDVVFKARAGRQHLQGFSPFIGAC